MARDNIWKFENDEWVDNSSCENCARCEIRDGKMYCTHNKWNVDEESFCAFWKSIEDYPMTCVKTGTFDILSTSLFETGRIYAGQVAYRVGKRIIGDELFVTLKQGNTYYEIGSHVLHFFFKDGAVPLSIVKGGDDNE